MQLWSHKLQNSIINCYNVTKLPKTSIYIKCMVHIAKNDLSINQKINSSKIIFLSFIFSSLGGMMYVLFAALSLIFGRNMMNYEVLYILNHKTGIIFAEINISLAISAAMTLVYLVICEKNE